MRNTSVMAFALIFMMVLSGIRGVVAIEEQKPTGEIDMPLIPEPPLPCSLEWSLSTLRDLPKNMRKTYQQGIEGFKEAYEKSPGLEGFIMGLLSYVIMLLVNCVSIPGVLLEVVCSILFIPCTTFVSFCGLFHRTERFILNLLLDPIINRVVETICY